MVDMDGRLFRAVHLPCAVRVGRWAVRELADDMAREGIGRVRLVWSRGLPEAVERTVRWVLSTGKIQLSGEWHAEAGTMAEAAGVVAESGAECSDAVLAVGGGRALDVGKYAAALSGAKSVTFPTSLSHDGFASPSASLVGADGRRVSLLCKGPAVVVVDTEMCASAPRCLFAAGVGDVMAKVTALLDWWLVEFAGEGPVDGIAAAVANGAVAELEGHPEPDAAGHERLARALLLGGVAMGIAGSSRPASGSEHLVSHALDRLRTPPGSHGVQVGIAAYVLAHLHERDGINPAGRIAAVFDRAGFWEAARHEGLTLDLFERALRAAPQIKPGYTTVLSRPGAAEAAMDVARRDERLRPIWH